MCDQVTLQAWSELTSTLQHQILIIIIYLQNLVIVHKFFITHVFNFLGITISHRSTWNTCWRFSLYPLYPAFSGITTSHECWVYHEGFGLPTTQTPRRVTRNQSFSVAAQFRNHGNTQQSSYFFDWCVAMVTTLCTVMLQEFCLAMWNGHIETLMLMERYIATFTCKTTAHCTFYIKYITCRHYLHLWHRHRNPEGGEVTGGMCYIHSMCTTKLNCPPINKSSLYVT